jgi:hypothetical protein
MAAARRAAERRKEDDMTRYLNGEGAPLRGDGTPFPSDPGEWSPQEREYLEAYYFTGELTSGIEDEQIAVVDVPEMVGDSEGGSWA